MATCNTIGIENFQTWRILHHGLFGRALGAYLTEVNEGMVGNHFSTTKLPVLYKGSTPGPSPDNAVTSNWGWTANLGRVMTLRGLDGAFTDERYIAYSVFLR